jgi:transcriptional regulator with XRE-family HTH domain
VDFRKQIGQNVRTHRRDLGLTQESLGLDAKVAISKISNIENGKVDPRVGTLLRIAEGLEVRLADLVEGVP